MNAGRLVLAAVVSLAGCGPGASSRVEPPPPPLPPPPKREAVELRLLYTSDEHGWIQRVHDVGKPFRDGAAALLSVWRTREGHCVPSSADACAGSATLALSGGDNWTGPAISSHFRGASAAETLAKLGYAAGALGNHELDFGRAVFEKNREVQGFPYLAANVTPTRSAGGVAEPYAIFERRGVRIGVVGLSTHETVKAGLRDNYRGLTFGDEEDALTQFVPKVYDAGADAVVVVGHVCAKDFQRIVDRHPEWKLAFVGAGHCHRVDRRESGDTPIVEPGSFLKHYVRVSLTIHPERPARERVTRSAIEVVSLEHPPDAPPLAPPDPAVAEIVARWDEKTQAVLGEVLGHTRKRLDPDSPALANFITDAWRSATGADVAILNRFATRQALPIGAIKRETIVSILPFENRLVTVSITGADLERNVRCCGGHVSGVVEKNGELVLAGGARIEKDKRYKVTSTDYAYYGGSGFTFEKDDPNGVFGEDWREPVVRALVAAKTTEERGLDTLVDRTARLTEREAPRH